MFGLFSTRRRGHSSAPKYRRSSLGMELLESRDNPSPGFPGGTILPPDSPPINPSPELSVNSIVYDGQAQVTLSGQINYTGDPTEVGIVIEGAVSAFTFANSEGEFSISTNAVAVGEVSFQAMPLEGDPSNLVVLEVVTDAPVVTEFTASGGTTGATSHIWEFAGLIEDEDPEGLVVHFSGSVPTLNAETATVAEDGSFLVVVYLEPYPLDTGVAYASVTDWFGVTSELDSVLVLRSP